MERRTRDTERKEAFNKQARLAKDLALEALRAIDSTLREQEEHLAWLEYEGYTPEQVDSQLRDWQLEQRSNKIGSPEKQSDQQ